MRTMDITGVKIRVYKVNAMWDHLQRNRNAANRMVLYGAKTILHSVILLVFLLLILHVALRIISIGVITNVRINQLIKLVVLSHLLMGSGVRQE